MIKLENKTLYGVPQKVKMLITRWNIPFFQKTKMENHKFLTCLSGGKIGTGPFLREIGGKGIALIILVLTLIYFFNSVIFIVDIKLIIVWPFLNFNFGRIIFPIVGVTAKKTQFDWFIISWLSADIFIFLLFLLSSLEIFEFLFETIFLLIN